LYSRYFCGGGGGADDDDDDDDVVFKGKIGELAFIKA
jgi:hypothetical protein